MPLNLPEFRLSCWCKPILGKSGQIIPLVTHSCDWKQIIAFYDGTCFTQMEQQEKDALLS
jgi:hypothetical protein